MVIPKPNKTAEQKKTASGWRSIALLSTIEKVIETVVSQRITAAAEDRGLLPDGQMGNRAARSTELAIRAVQELVYTTWARKGVPSLLQLDIKGAFDTVNHIRLVATLQELGFPNWLL